MATNTWDTVQDRVSKNANYLVMLYDRWHEEHEYEDFNEYIQAIQKKFDGLKLYCFKNKPFSFRIKATNNQDILITVKDDKIVLKEVII